MTASTMTLNLSPVEMQALDQLCLEHDMSKTAVLRQALRLYQSLHQHLKNGERIILSGDVQRALDFVGPGFGQDLRSPAPETNKRGIYIASKTKHADRWRLLRDAGLPITSTWIDEAGAGESGDLSDLWRRCILEASTASVLVLYREPDDVLKGGWVELGAALACGVPVFAIGIEEFTIAKDKRIRHFATLDAALAVAAAEADR